VTQAAVVCTRTRRRLMRSSIVDRRRLSRAILVATRARIIIIAGGGGRCSDIRRRRVRTFGVYVLIIYVTRPSLVVVVARIHHDVRDLIRIMPFVHNTPRARTHAHAHAHTHGARETSSTGAVWSVGRSVGRTVGRSVGRCKWLKPLGFGRNVPCFPVPSSPSPHAMA